MRRATSMDVGTVLECLKNIHKVYHAPVQYGVGDYVTVRKSMLYLETLHGVPMIVLEMRNIEDIGCARDNVRVGYIDANGSVFTPWLEHWGLEPWTLDKLPGSGPTVKIVEVRQ
jgi:hypothetical protein